MPNILLAMIHAGGFDCPCGQHHSAKLKDLVIESGALKRIPQLIQTYQKKKAFILTDTNEYAAAGAALCGILTEASIPYSLYVFPQAHLEPDEAAVGAAVMHFDPDCDLILGVGSGVVCLASCMYLSVSEKESRPFSLSLTACSPPVIGPIGMDMPENTLTI